MKIRPHTFLFIIFCYTIFLSCGRYVQVFECASDNVQLNSNSFFYETDSVRVSYNFWYQKGIMLFRVHNKLSVPIYINWKKSYFKYNGISGSYLKDSIPVSSLEYASSDAKISFGAVYVESKNYEGETMSEIPSHSNFDRYLYVLFPSEYLYLNKSDVKTVEVPYNNNTSKNTIMHTVSYNADDSPVQFDNYLHIFFTEDIPQPFAVENNFYVSGIKEMKEHHCFQILKNQYNNLVQGDGDFKFVYTSKFEKPNVFYGYIPEKDRFKPSREK